MIDNPEKNCGRSLCIYMYTTDTDMEEHENVIPPKANVSKDCNGVRSTTCGLYIADNLEVQES